MQSPQALVYRYRGTYGTGPSPHYPPYGVPPLPYCILVSLPPQQSNDNATPVLPLLRSAAYALLRFEYQAVSYHKESPKSHTMPVQTSRPVLPLLRADRDSHELHTTPAHSYPSVYAASATGRPNPHRRTHRRRAGLPALTADVLLQIQEFSFAL